MIEQDTIRLLRECDAGVKMGISSIEDVIDRVQQKAMGRILSDCKDEHLQLHKKIQQRLEQFDDEGKNPNLGGGLCVGRLWHWRNYGSASDGR